MQSKANIVNIGLQTKVLRKVQTRCSWVEDKDDEGGLEGFVKSKQSTKLMYELLSIIKSQPITVSDITNMLTVNTSYPSTTSPTPSQSQQQQYLQEHQQQQQPHRSQSQPQSPSYIQQAQPQPTTPILSLQLQIIVPEQTDQVGFQGTLQSCSSISQQISKTNTIYIPNIHEQQESSQAVVIDSINQQQGMMGEKQTYLYRGVQHKKKSQFYPDTNANNRDNNYSANRTIQSTNTNVNSLKYINLKGNEPFYIIPNKYQANLQFLITHFLKFKIYNTTKKESMSASVSKRPLTTGKHLRYSKVQTLGSTQNKPSTANLRISTTHPTKIITTPTTPLTLSQDMNYHLQNLIVMQKQLQRKSKRIIELENQLLSFSHTIKQKNAQIKELQQIEHCLKKKFKYEVDKMMKGKVMTDINEMFLSNLNQDNNFGRSVFEINGKKYVKTEGVGNMGETTFLTTPKMSMFMRSNDSSFQLMGRAQSTQTLKKSQSSLTLLRKTRLANKHLQTIRVTKQLQCLRKQLFKYQQQKSQLQQRLAENNSKIEKCIQKIQQQIDVKKEEIAKLTEELERLKES